MTDSGSGSGSEPATDETFWTTRAEGTGATVYHSRADCWRLTRAKRPKQRDRSYIEWHELDPCPHCCEEG